MEHKKKEPNRKGEPSLPNAKVGQVSELLVKLGILGGMSDREGLAYALGINKNSLGHPLKAAELLNFVSTEEGNVRITEPGEKFAQGDEDSKRKLFLEQLKLVEPFATMVRAHQSRDVLDVREALNLVKAKSLRSPEVGIRYRPGDDEGGNQLA